MKNFHMQFGTIKIILLSMFCFTLAIHSQGQITITENPTPEEAISEFLGEGVMATNVEFTGNDNQMGLFDCDSCGLGMEYGIGFSTGDISDAVGPNSSGSTSTSYGFDNTEDSDLALLLGEPFGQLNDVVTFELDFVAAGDTAYFDYVWASEEYPEFVNGVNDLFGLFISGPGINGDFSNEAENIALIPSTDLFISINNLNNGNDGVNGPCVNCEYYIDNNYSGDEENSDPTGIEYDGHTTVMTAMIAGLQVGETYHLKLAMADVLDGVYDSAVFFGGGSIYSNKSFIEFQNDEATALGVDSVYECNSTLLEISRSVDINVDQTIELNIEGTAVSGEDYNEIPSSVTIPAGEASVSIPVEILEDDEEEGSETIEVQYPIENAFDDQDFTVTATLTILDNPLVEPVPEDLISESAIQTCLGDSVVLSAVDMNFEYFQFHWSTEGEDFSDDTEVVVNPEASTEYVFSLQDVCGNPYSDTVSVTVVDIESAVISDSTSLMAVEEGADYQWLDCQEGMAEIEGETGQTFTPSASGEYAVSINLEGCEVNSDCVPFTTIGVFENTLASKIIAYPNPAEDDIHFQLNGRSLIGKKYQIVSSSGKTVLSGEIKSSEFILNISQLPQCIYQFVVEDGTAVGFVKNE